MKLSRPSLTVVLAIACLHGGPLAARAGAQTWRCGSTYSDQPCSGGKLIELEDAPNPAQRREADAATREALTAANRMEQERLRLEADHARRGPALIDNRPRQPSTAHAPKQGKKSKAKKDSGYFSAHDPVSTAKNKAEKAAGKKRSNGR